MFKKINTFLQNVWVPLFFFLIIFFFFLGFFLQGKVPVALDIPTGMYYPWLNQSFGYLVRVPVKNPILTDTVSQFWIWRNWAVSGLTKGDLRIWNPYSFSGFEISPWFHSILFSPLNLFYFFFDQLNSMSLVIISQLLVSFFGTYLFSLRICKSKPSSVFFALSWSLSSYFLGWLTWGSVSFALAMLPFCLHSLLLLNHKIDKTSILYCFFALASLILSGHPQTIAYCIFIVFVSFIYLFYQNKNKKFFYTTVSIFFISILFLSPVLLPSLTIIKNSVRFFDNHLLGVNYGLVRWSDFLSLLLTPNFFGNPATNNYFGGGYNYQEKLVYIGLVPLYFLVVNLVYLFKNKKVTSDIQKMGLFFLSLGLAISIANPIGYLIYFLKIPILSSSPAGRGIIIFTFGSLLLSFEAFLMWQKNKISFKTFFISFFFLFFPLIFSLITAKATLYFIANQPASLQSDYLTLKNNLTTTFRNLIPSLAILVLTFGVVSLSFIKRNFLKLSFVIIFFIVIGDSFLFFKKYTPFVPKNLYFPETKTLNFLNQKKDSLGFFRIERQSAEILPPNMWEAYGLYSASGYDPMANLNYQNFLQSQGAISNYSRYIELGEQISKINQLGIKYLLVLKRDRSGILSDKGDLPHFVDQKNWKEVFSDGPVAILENQYFQPPYTLSESGTVKILNHSSNRITFEVDSKTIVNLVFYQNYSPNWHLKNQTKVQNLYQTKDGFMQISLPEGHSKVELTYKNQEFSLGLIFSFISLILLFFVIHHSKD